jgi:hypothetical protein
MTFGSFTPSLAVMVHPLIRHCDMFPSTLPSADALRDDLDDKGGDHRSNISTTKFKFRLNS